MHMKLARTALAATVLAAAAYTAGALTQSAGTAVTTDFAQDDVKLEKPESPFDSKGVHTVTLGDKLKFECRMHIDEFFDKSIINAGATITNPTSTPMHFEYNIAFFNERGQLIGCASQGSFGGLEPQQTTQLGSCLIALEPDDIDTVRSYQIRVYESPREVGGTKTLAAE